MNKLLKRLLLLALLAVPWATQAQDTLTVADGTTTNSYVPFYGLWMDANQHNQVLYPASMTAEIVGDSIKGMGFYMSSSNSTAWGATVTISLGISSNATLTGLDNSTVLTQVWSGTVDGQGDIWITFDNAYAFQGGNLLVDFQSTTAGNYGSSSFYGVSQPAASFYSYNTSGSSQDFIPKTSFLHVDGDFDVCLMPTALNVVASPYSATLSWTAPEGVTDFVVTLNGQPVDNVSNPMTITELVPGTNYTVSVRSICTSGDTSYAATTSFLTPCVAFAAPYTDNFDASSSLSVCYNVLSYYNSYGTIYPYISSGTSYSGNRSLYFYTYSTENFVVAPSVDLAGNNMHVSFWGNGSGQLIAGVVTDRNDMSTFIALDTAQGDPDGRWLEYDFYTDAVTADSAYVAFKLTGNGFYLDDLMIEASTSCRRPMAAVIDSADTVSVSLHWTPATSGSATYEIGYAPVYDLSEVTIVSDITDTFAVVTGLTPNVYNFFWVRAICGDDTTHWTYAGNVRTDCSPDGMVAPYVEDFMGYANVDVPNCWNVLLSTVSYSTTYPYVYSGTSYGYLVMYPKYEEPNLIVAPKMRLPVNEIAVELSYEGGYSGTANFELGYVTNPNADSTFVALDTVVVSGTVRNEYEFNTGSVTDVDSLWIAFRASVAGSSQYAYVYIYDLTIKHLSNCQRPSMVSLDTVGHDMAILSWDSVAENYEILVSTTNNVNDPNATTIQVSGSNTGVVDNLQPSTKYYTWVRSDCGDEQSEWRIGPSFVTRCGEDYCLVSVRAVDSYQYAAMYNAINVYVDSVLRDVIDYNNYGTYNVNVQYDVCDGDTLTLTYYPFGSTYNNYDDYVTVTVTDGSGAQVFSGTCGSYADGDTIVRLTKPCPTCMPVASVAVDDDMSDANNLTAYWVPNAAHSGEQVEYVLTLNGAEVATVTDTFYTFTNLTAETSYTIGVATKCSDDDTAMFVYTTVLTDCEGGSCNVSVVMHDSYGDGWNNAQLSVVQNGITKGSFTISSGNSLTANVKACQGDSLQLFWTAGNYDNEISFEVIGLGGDTLFNSASATLATGLLATTDTVICPACISPNTVNVSNISLTGADVSWNANGLADSWVVTVSNDGTLVSSATVNTPSYQITGLTPATFYTVGVASICGGDTAVATTATFATLCSEITLPWYFNAMSDPSALDNTMPLCWYSPETFVYASYYGDETYPYNSTYSGIQIQVMGTGSCMAATPRIPAPANNLYIRANLSMYEDAGVATIQIGFISNPAQPSTFIPLQTLSAGSGEYEFITTGVAGIPADSLHIAFRASSTSSNDYYGAYINVEDIYVQVAPSCLRPDSVTFSNITTTSATIGWTNTGANHYLVSVNDTVYNVTTNSVNVTGLAAGTTYTVAIQGICSDSSIVRYAEFTSGCDFTTLPYFEDFENGTSYHLLNCWTSFNTYPDYSGNLSPYVYSASYYAHSGTNSLYLYGPSTKKVMAVSGALTGAPINQLHVNFWAQASSYGFEAGLMTDPNDTTTFIKLLDHSPASYGDPQYSMYHYEFNTDTITSTATTYYFAIRLINPDSYAGGIYVDDISLSIMPDCSESFNTVAVPGGMLTGESAEVLWTVGPGINNGATYTVTVLDANNTVVTTINDAVSPQTVSGLLAETPYQVVVSLNCGGQVTAVSDTVSFTTRCAGAITASSYNADMTATTTSFAPIGYSTYNYSYVQTIIDSAQMASLNGGNGAPTAISTFAFLPLSVTEGSAQFNGMYVYMANVSETDLSAGFIMPDASHHFDTVISNGCFNYTEAEWQYHNFDTAFTWDGHSNVLFAVNRVNGTWKSTPSFSAHQTADVKTRYRYNDDNAYDISTVTDGTTLNLVGDLIFMSCGAGCQAPDNINVSDLTYENATLNWSGNAEQYEVAYKMAAEATWPAEVSVNGNSLQLTSLQPAKQYVFRVRAICDAEAGVISDWAEFTFTTDSLPCFAPTALEATATSYTSVTLDWTAGGIETQWGIHVWNTNFDTTLVVNAHPATVGGLDQAMTYNAEVKSICGGGLLESEYCEAIPFTTATCEQVTGLAVSNVTATSAVVSWDGNASSYEIDYGGLNHSQGTGTVVTTTGNSYTITGLEPDMMYSVFVRAICETGVYGAWSAQEDFQTPEGTEGIQEANSAQIAIQPNPANESTTIVLSGVNGDVTVSVVDMNGRVVLTESMSCSGNCQKRIDVDGLAQGAYFVRLSGADLNMVKKLIVK